MAEAKPGSGMLATVGRTANRTGLSSDGCTITVWVPLVLRKRGGRKVVVAPDGAAPVGLPARSARPHGAMVKTLARAFRWRRMLESGAYATIAELANAEKVDPSYLGRILRLTQLAPEIVETILGRRQRPSITLKDLRDQCSVEWEKHWPPN